MDNFEKKIISDLMTGKKITVGYIYDNKRALRKLPSKYREYFLAKPTLAYHYAMYVDEHKPSDETREACLKSANFAFQYAMIIDKKARKDTWNVVKGTTFELSYLEKLGDPER